MTRVRNMLLKVNMLQTVQDIGHQLVEYAAKFQRTDPYHYMAPS
jgi:hypothetical protein